MESYKDELYHHGVKGQKWGVRHNSQAGNREAYAKKLSSAKESLEKQGQNVVSSTSNLSGTYGSQRKTAGKTYNNSVRNLNKKSAQYIVAKANYKRASALTDKGGERAEFKTYVKEMKKRGLPDSQRDAEYGKAGTLLADEISAAKGEKYTNKVMKRANNQIVTGAAVTTVASAGAVAASLYLIRAL